jgi:hypothetical protein
MEKKDKRKDNIRQKPKSNTDRASLAKLNKIKYTFV